jgi:cellulose synthase/poly-beta-1,6-N-acetylglucosamine synthase-like glycosyltransferase
MSTTFWFCASLLFYIFAGYPLLLLVLAKLVPSANLSDEQASGEDEDLPEVETIVIVRNVAEIIEDKIHSLLQLDYPSNKFSVLFVSDSSDDQTVSIINSLHLPNVRCIENKHKSSKSACLNQAIEESNAEILFMTDARQKHASDSLRKLVTHFKDSSVGAVSGELILMDPDTNEFSKGMDAYWRYEKMIRATESKIASVPGVTGAVYAMRRSDYQDIPDETLLDDVLIPMNMILKGKRVLFESGAHAYDVPSEDPKREKIRKTRTLAGNWQLLELRPALLNPFKNAILIQFLSHKILRLIAPFLLLGMLVSSALLIQTPFFLIALIIQILGYSLVILSQVNALFLKVPLVKIAASFMILMWFTFLGFWSFVTRQHLTIWK